MSADDAQVIYFLIAAAVAAFFLITVPDSLDDPGMGFTVLLVATVWPLAVGIALVVLCFKFVVLLFKRKTYYHLRRFFWKTDLEIEQESGHG